MVDPLVRIGIVSYNTAELLRSCLDALPAALNGVAAEVVVVDNASSDGSGELLGRNDGVRVVQNSSNVGYARAMNVALSGSASPFLLALNPDTIPAPQSLRMLISRLRETPDVALVVPVLRNSDGSLQDSVHRFPSVRAALLMHFVPLGLRGRPVFSRWWFQSSAHLTGPTDVDWAVGAVHCLRRGALDGQPPYTERWFMYAEDMELCWRLRQHGWRILVEPSAQVLHVGNAAAGRRWSDRAREAKWLSATYDWYVDARGAGQARLWAAANTLGLLTKAVAISSGVGHHSTTEHRRLHARQVLFLASLHARRVLNPRGRRAD
jgi:N-acetylglucosaminyl-diphospho-decaprenol L-rhamnosyltransferase